MACIYIDVKEQSIRNLIHQLPDDQYKLDKYVEIDKNYDMSQSNVQAPNLTGNTNTKYAIK